MRIGIVGAGNVGKNLGIGFLRAGHEVMWSSRSDDPERRRAILADADGGSVGSVEETIDFGDVVVLAVGGDQTLDVASRREDWSGKVVVDATNLIGRRPDRSPTLAFAEAAPGASVARAFNSIGANTYLNPVFGGQAASMFLCGSDDRARQTASQLAADLGFRPVEVGDLEQAPMLDELARLWVTLARSGMGREFALDAVRR